MDNLTHSLTGILLGPRRPQPPRPARHRCSPSSPPTCPTSISSPSFNGSLYYLAQHRGFTHALFWSPLVALAALPSGGCFARKRTTSPDATGPEPISSPSSPSSATTGRLPQRLRHPPATAFPAAWPRLDLVHIIDVWIWRILLVCTLGPMLGAPGRQRDRRPRRPGAPEHGHHRPRPGRRSTSPAAPTCTPAPSKHSSPASTTGAPAVTAALPSAGEPLALDRPRRNQSAGGYVTPSTSLCATSTPMPAVSSTNPTIARVRAAVLQTETAACFLDFAQCPVWRITPRHRARGRIARHASTICASACPTKARSPATSSSTPLKSPCANVLLWHHEIGVAMPNDRLPHVDRRPRRQHRRTPHRPYPLQRRTLSPQSSPPRAAELELAVQAAAGRAAPVMRELTRDQRSAILRRASARLLERKEDLPAPSVPRAASRSAKARLEVDRAASDSAVLLRGGPPPRRRSRTHGCLARRPGPHGLHHPRAPRGHRRHHAVQLPSQSFRPQNRAGPRRRQQPWSTNPPPPRLSAPSCSPACLPNAASRPEPSTS